MSTELATTDVFPAEKIDLLKRTICNGATNDELELFIHACRRTGLDPFMKQIHAVKRWDKKAKRAVMAIQTGIDGYRLIADRSGKYAGNDDPKFHEDDKGIYAATVTVFKLVGGIRCPFSATARWGEYYPGDDQGFMWNKMPHVMLGKVAEALALRKAFPAELSGLYTSEEMEQAGPPMIDAPQQASTPAPPQRQAKPAEPTADAFDPMPDSEKFVAMLRDVFEVADFQPEEFSAAVADTCKRLKIRTIARLPVEKRQPMIDAVANGKFDKYKKAVTA